MKRLLTIAVLLLSLTASATLYESRDRRIAISAGMRTGKEWLEFVLRADKDVQQLLGLDEKTAPAHSLRIDVGKQSDASHPFHLRFTGKEYRSWLVHRVYASLLLRAATPPRAAPVTLPSVEWMAAALALRELTADEERLGRMPIDYQPVRVGFQHGVFPVVERLLTEPVPADKPMLFRFYATHCGVFVAAIESQAGLNENPFRQILDLELHGRTTMVALAFVLSPHFQNDENPQTWYERVAPLVSRKGRRQSRGDDVLARLNDLTTVPALNMGGGADRIKRVPIEDLTSRLEDYRLDMTAIARIYEQMFELYKDAPVLLQEPLMAHMGAFDSLRKGKTRRFRRELKKARAQFAEALKRQRGVEELLDSMEDDTSAPDKRFAPYLQVVERVDEDLRQLDPKLDEVLDKAAK